MFKLYLVSAIVGLTSSLPSFCLWLCCRRPVFPAAVVDKPPQDDASLLGAALQRHLRLELVWMEEWPSLVRIDRDSVVEIVGPVSAGADVGGGGGGDGAGAGAGAVGVGVGGAVGVGAVGAAAAAAAASTNQLFAILQRLFW